MVTLPQMVGRARRKPTAPTVLSLIYFANHGSDVNSHRHILTTRNEVETAVEKLMAGEDSSTEVECAIHDYESIIADWIENNDESRNLCLSEDHSVFYFGSQDGGEVVEDRIQQYKMAGRKLGDLI